MIDSLGDDDLRRDVAKLDQSFAAGDISCCLYVGRILDTIIRDYIRYPEKSTAEEREAMTLDQFRFELDAKCQFKNIEYRFLKSANIFDDWKKKYVSRDGKERTSFKADMTDIVLRTNLVDLPAMYPLFLDELFNVYSSRNKAVHADREAQVDRDMIQKLEKALKVLFQLI